VSPPESSLTPFVGLRPYTEAERAFFKGRDRDAVLLRNKILSSPITVLYALSGIGKSSLLRALLEPSLREDGAHVVYYEEWAEHDPVQGLRLELRHSIPSELRSVAPGASLAAVAKAAATALSRPIVLILDQFEKLLLQRREALDPFAAELAALIHAECDVHVLLSLREEFLASLDVLRDRMIMLLSSTHRLRPLDDASVREAIVSPAEQCGGSVEPGLVDALLQELRANPSDEQPAVARLVAGHVELPFLQLVCRQLWLTAGDEHRLTLAQYEHLGREEGIVREYIQGITAPLRPGQRAKLARLLNQLAPRDGAKIALPEQQLFEMAKVPPDDARHLLGHLEKDYVVRIRPTRMTTWYELYHDAFIRVLRSWVDRELNRAKYRRWGWRAAVVFLVLQALVIWAVSWKQSMDKRTHTKAIADLASVAWRGRESEVAIDEAAYWFLHQAANDSSGESIGELLRTLESIRGKIQQHYGREESRSPGASEESRSITSSGPVVADPSSRPTAAAQLSNDMPLIVCQTPGATSDRSWGVATMSTRAPGRSFVEPTGCENSTAELQLMHGVQVAIEDQRLLDAWVEASRFLRDSVGLPLPWRVKSVSDGQMPAQEVRLRVLDGRTTSTFELSLLDSILIVEDRLNARVRQYLRSHHDKRWKTVWASGGTWWRVPRWTFPVWRAGGQPVLTAEQLIVTSAVAKLTEHPEVLLNPRAMTRLVQRGGGRGLAPNDARDMFVALVAARHSIRNKSDLLTHLARYTGPKDDSLPGRVWRATIEANCNLPAVGNVEVSQDLTPPSSAEFREVLDALPGDSTRAAREQRLQLCIVKRLLAEQSIARATETIEHLPVAGDRWTPEENYLLGYWSMDLSGARPDGEMLPGTLDRFAAAFPALDESRVDSAYHELRSLCYTTWRARQCWRALDTIARMRPDNFLMAFYAGLDLADRPGKDEAKAALLQLSRADGLVNASPYPSFYQAWIHLSRVKALQTLADHDDPGAAQLPAAIDSLAEILRGPDVQFPIWRVFNTLVAQHVFAGKFAQADSVLAMWAAAARDTSGEYDRKSWVFFVDLANLRDSAARGVAESMRAESPQPGVLYMLALSSFLQDGQDATGDAAGGALYQTGHVYSDYVRMMQYWSFSARGDTKGAQLLIADRWAQIDSTSWRDRLNAGDEAVWRETLIGMYAGAIPVAAVEAIAAHQETSPYRWLGMPARGIQCEAAFYTALYLAASAPADTRREEVAQALSRAIDTRFTSYYEYHMARILQPRYEKALGNRRRKAASSGGV